jgi:mRNA interferase MazF
MVGDVLWATFPYTDLSGVLAEVGMRDWILCEITSVGQVRPGDIAIADSDMQAGRLRRRSRFRPSRLHTLNESVFRRYIGRLTDAKLAEILAAVRALF